MDVGSGNRSNDRHAYPASAADFEAYRVAHAQLDQMRIPLLLDSRNPHQRLYVAAMDGTGNSLYDDPRDTWSVVAKIHQQVQDLNRQGIDRIASGYVEGTFTQNGLVRFPSKVIDGRFAHTFDERLESAYYDLCVQAKAWLDKDPDAQIRLLGIGFSRGAEGIAALQRLVDERGIRDPLGAQVQRDSEGVVTRIRYADVPPLVLPGKTLQAALLYDPVQTGVEDEHRCLAPTTVSTLQISARDEKRNLFRASDHVPVGFSEDGRNLNVILPGAHSDKGGTYRERGLGTLAFNFGVAFVNRTSDVPFLKPHALPEDPSQYVIHRSEKGMFGLYRTSGFDRDGIRDRVDDCSPQPGIQRKDPIGADSDARVERRTGAPSDHPAVSPAMPAFKRSQAGAYLDRLLQAYGSDDAQAVARVLDDYRQSTAGQAWQQAVEARAVAERVVPEPPPQPEALVVRMPALRH